MLSIRRKKVLASLLTTVLATKHASQTIAKPDRTTAPITNAPSTELALLIRDQRLHWDICGYKDREKDQPLGCPESSYCDRDNIYSLIGCCAIFSSNGGFDPWSCGYWTTCYDSTQSELFATDRSARMPGGQGGDTFAAMYCSNTASPYCKIRSLTDQGYTAWGCGSASGVIEEYATFYYEHDASTDKDDSANLFTPVQTSAEHSKSLSMSASAATSIVTSNDDGLATTPQPTAGTTSEIPEQNDTGSSNRTGVIIGGVFGGFATIAVGAAAIMLLRSKKKRKETNIDATQPSFNVIGSNISAPLPSTVESIGPMPPIQARATTPCLSEIGSDNGGSIKPAEAPGVVYQPYRRHESKASVLTLEPNTFLPYHPQYPTSVPAQHLDRNSSFTQLSEMDVMSASSSRHNTNMSPERRQSRFAELDAPYMSMQSGPIPEWGAPNRSRHRADQEPRRM